MAHHLHALHRTEDETTQYKNPFIEHTNYSRCPFCGEIENTWSLRRHLHHIHDIYVPLSLRITKEKVKERTIDQSNPFGKFFPSKNKDDSGFVECPRCLEDVEVKEFNEHYINLHELVCSFCLKKCKTKYEKMLHVAKEHNVSRTDESVTSKENQCPICTQMFLHKNEVKRHVEIVHLNLRNHLCDICGSSFTRKSGLNAHRAKHFNIRLLQCKLCPKRYNQTSMIKKHLKTKHGIIPEGRYNSPLTDKKTLPWVKLTIEEDRALQEMETSAGKSKSKNKSVKQKIDVSEVLEYEGGEIGAEESLQFAFG